MLAAARIEPHSMLPEQLEAVMDLPGRESNRVVAAGSISK
jgi:hypothetical protein